jgi:hypothetical protein
MSVTPVRSEVLDAAVVVVLDVVAREVGDQSPALGADGTGTVELAVVEVLKGRVAATSGDHVVVAVEVHGSGRWTTATTRPGSRLVAFCAGGSTDLRVLLGPDARPDLVEDDGVADDVRLVRTVQRRHPTADRLLQEAERQRAVGGAAFARYVWVSAREALRTSIDRFDRLMAIAEDAATRVAAQEAYLVSAYTDITFTDDFSTAHRARLARAMLRSALDPRLGELRGTLLGTYLPNLVSASLPEPLTPEAVFDDADGTGLRAAAVVELDDPRDPATTSPALRDWLATGGGR